VAYDLPRTKTSPAQLAAALRESFGTLLRLTGGFTPEQWIGPYLPVVNPPLWELGHVGWFLERWVLRRAGAAQLRQDADRLYDSMRVAHAARWFLPLPGIEATQAYVMDATNAVLQRLEDGRLVAPEDLYYVELALFHQDMHNEAFRYMRQTWGYADPLAAGPLPAAAPGAAAPGDAEIPAGLLLLGATRGDGFVFDNEKWAHEVAVPAFRIARRCVGNAEFAAFVEDGGYLRRALWSEAGWRWREEQGLTRPACWRRAGAGAGWQRRAFDRWVELAPELPVMHVSAHEAEAWCRWAGRRLPSEAEWERAAAAGPDGQARRVRPWGDAAVDPGRANLGGAGPAPVDACPAGDSAWGCRQMLGNVWEWTASEFLPYPGFAVDPYEDYSRPWFGSHRVLRGGSFATVPRLARSAYRNFYRPERNDIFCGFRTCAT
jgi:iron(II)-dependent oxidoreductase